MSDQFVKKDDALVSNKEIVDSIKKANEDYDKSSFVVDKKEEPVKVVKEVELASPVKPLVLSPTKESLVTKDEGKGSVQPSGVPSVGNMGIVYNRGDGLRFILKRYCADSMFADKAYDEIVYLLDNQRLRE